MLHCHTLTLSTFLKVLTFLDIFLNLSSNRIESSKNLHRCICPICDILQLWSFVGLCITAHKKISCSIKTLGSFIYFFPKISEAYPMWFRHLHLGRDKLGAPSGRDSSAETLPLANQTCCSRPDTVSLFHQ